MGERLDTWYQQDCTWKYYYSGVGSREGDWSSLTGPAGEGASGSPHALSTHAPDKPCNLPQDKVRELGAENIAKYES